MCECMYHCWDQHRVNHMDPMCTTRFGAVQHLVLWKGIITHALLVTVLIPINGIIGTYPQYTITLEKMRKYS